MRRAFSLFFFLFWIFRVGIERHATCVGRRTGDTTETPPPGGGRDIRGRKRVLLRFFWFLLTRREVVGMKW